MKRNLNFEKQVKSAAVLLRNGEDHAYVEGLFASHFKMSMQRAAKIVEYAKMYNGSEDFRAAMKIIAQLLPQIPDENERIPVWRKGKELLEDFAGRGKEIPEKATGDKGRDDLLYTLHSNEMLAFIRLLDEYCPAGQNQLIISN
jgi:hypothetical protein